MKISKMISKTKAYAGAAKTSAERFKEGSSIIDSLKESAVDFKRAGLADCKGVYRFTQSDRFNGYKRFRVSYYGYEPAEEGLKQFHRLGSILDDAEILLNPTARGDFQMIEVFVNGFRIGSVFFGNEDDDVTDFIENKLLCGLVTGAHIRFETQTVIGKGRFGQTITEERDRIYLFLKASEE